MPLWQTTHPDFWIQKIHLFDNNTLVLWARHVGSWLLWSGQKDGDFGLLGAGISGSEWRGRRIPEVHLLGQPAFPAWLPTPVAHPPPLDWFGRGPSPSSCLLSFHPCSCCLAPEPSLQVRSLPICQGLVQVPPSCPHRKGCLPLRDNRRVLESGAF